MYEPSAINGKAFRLTVLNKIILNAKRTLFSASERYHIPCKRHKSNNLNFTRLSLYDKSNFRTLYKNYSGMP